MALWISASRGKLKPQNKEYLVSKLVIATRESPLALWQANYVADRLRALYPELTVELLGMTSRGDQLLDKPLYKVGG